VSSSRRRGCWHHLHLQVSRSRLRAGMSSSSGGSRSSSQQKKGGATGQGKPKRSTSEDKRKKAEEDKVRREEEDGEEAKLRKRMTEPMDIMAQKGYYDELYNSMDERTSKKAAMDAEIQLDQDEQKELETTMAKMTKWLVDHEPSIEEKKKQLADIDRKLAELEDPNLDPAEAARKLKAANMPTCDNARANLMREEFRTKVLQETDFARFGLSATPRGGGVEAVETCNMEAAGLSRTYFPLKVPVRCYSPAGRPFNAAPAPPAIVFFHGGGYVMGDLDTHDWLCRSLAALAGSTVVSVDYRRAPEHKYPAAIDDAYAALQWVARGGLGGSRPRNLGVAGDCAGGGLAAACCLRAKDDPEGPAIAVQLLAYPWLDLRPSAPSMQHEFSDGRHGLSSDDCHWFRQSYAPLGADANGGGAWTEELDASPFLATSLAGLPRAFIVYPVHSMLADEAVSFVERFRADVGPEAVHTMRVEGPKHHFAVMANDQQSQNVVFAAATFASAMLWAPER